MVDIVLHKCNPCSHCKGTNTEFVKAVPYNVFRCNACPDIWEENADNIKNIIGQHHHGRDHITLNHGQKIQCFCNDCHEEYTSEIKWM